MSTGNSRPRLPNSVRLALKVVGGLAVGALVVFLGLALALLVYEPLFTLNPEEINRLPPQKRAAYLDSLFLNPNTSLECELCGIRIGHALEAICQDVQKTGDDRNYDAAKLVSVAKRVDDYRSHEATACTIMVLANDHVALAKVAEVYAGDTWTLEYCLGRREYLQKEGFLSEDGYRLKDSCDWGV